MPEIGGPTLMAENRRWPGRASNSSDSLAQDIRLVIAFASSVRFSP
jgi:hypothetical protein